MRTFTHVLLIISFLFVNTNVFSQTRQKEDTALVNKVIQESKSAMQENVELSITKAEQAIAIARRIKFPVGEAYAFKNIGLANEKQGKYLEALDFYGQSLKLFRAENDKVGIANLLNNIGSVYSQKGDDAKALEHCLESLKIAEETGDKLRIMSALINVGSIYHNKKDAKAINYLLQALPLCEEMGNNHAYGIIAANIGEIYADHGNSDKALVYYQKALAVDQNALSAAYAYNGIGKLHLKNGKYNVALKHHFKALSITDKLGEKLDEMRTLKGIANVLVAQNEYKAAIDRYQQAKALGEELGANVELKDLYQDMSVAYTKVSDYRNAFLYKTKYADIKDTLYNDETIKKMGRLQFDFDLYKKEGEITLLTKDKALKEAQLKRQEFARNTLVGGLGIAVMITGLLYRNYRVKVKTNKLLDKQKDEIEGLLLNILPAEVAKELQVTGNSVPKDYQSVSVMFTDFKGFTALADKMSPQELVEELNSCFVEFDNIIAKHNLEKIKTIGDSYMCAGGIPTSNDKHPYNIVEAALEIQEYMVKHNRKRSEAGLPTWDARIGIHVGPVVAGVVGKKKYAYDIWGSTVNIASRMESNGDAGRVNISASMHEMVKDKYSCTHRGKIHAKNLGDIDMYFVEPSGKVVSIDNAEKNTTQSGMAV